MSAGRSTILRSDARALPLADASVDLIVTSPPYFALRSYTDGGEHYADQIGSEPSPQEYIASLIDCTREWMRVLKPGGSLWVNLGDKYSGAQAQNISGANRAGDSARTWRQTDPRRTGIPNKSLMMLPERYRIACVDQLGLIARAVVIWSKPNGLPESVTDRVRRSHEDWVHLTKLPRYFSAVDEIREAHVYPNDTGRHRGLRNAHSPDAHDKGNTAFLNPLGKLPGSVWTIPTEPLTVPDHLGVDHFAAFPTEWPRRIILGWSPSGICVECGEGRRPVAERDPIDPRHLASNQRRPDGVLNSRTLSGSSILRTGLQAGQSPATRITGEACACPDASAPTRPAVVLDPLGGTGTTALVAAALGRSGISVDRSADYCRLGTWRTTDRREIARAMRVTKPEPVAREQLDLFEGVA